MREKNVRVIFSDKQMPLHKSMIALEKNGFAKNLIRYRIENNYYVGHSS